MRLATAAAFLLATGAVVAPLPSDRASASCAAPMLEVDEDGGDNRPVAGETLTVTGTSFVDGCEDSGGQDGPGCSAAPVDTENPLQDIELTITQRGRTWTLGTADAGGREDNRLGRVEWTVTLPAELRPGRARLHADGAAIYVLQIERPAG